LLNETNPLAAPRLFGGFAFRDDFTPDNTWAAFHPAHFILPHYQLVQVGSDSWLTINALIPNDEETTASLPVLQEALAARYGVLKNEGVKGRKGEGVTPAHPLTPSPLHPLTPATEGRPPAHPLIHYPMPYDTWAKQINDIRRQIRTTPLKKAVLSRMAELQFSNRVNVDGALAYLNEHYNDCYRFLFEPRPFHAFYGATPELLAKVEGHTLTSMALAGSIHRSADPLEDAALGQQLLNSAKDRHEHELVVYSILERLAPLTDKLEIAPQPGVYKINNIQHLYTPVRARLIEANGILPIAELLHPTPAMGGTPRRLAMQVIRDAEPVTRGWYAAPVGWIDVNLDGAFAVAIRSAVAQERRAWLYAGAGIVADSEPEKEWEETALKFRPMLEALQVQIET
jgi:menaquinone-specific isochorismate synthase